MSAVDPVQAALMAVATAHRPTSGMQVSSGVTCVCGYWTGSEPQGPIPGGWHMLLPHMLREASEAAVAAAEPHLTRPLADRLAAVEALADDAGCADPQFGKTCLEVESQARYWCLPCAIRAALATGATTNQQEGK